MLVELSGQQQLSLVPRKSQTFYTIDDLIHLPKPTWLIEGLFETQTLVMLTGPPGSYKSFMALNWLLSIASGQDNYGAKTLQSKVLYILGEGRSGILKRINAWIQYYGLSPYDKARLDANLRITFDVPQLCQKPSVDYFLSSLESEQFNPDVIVIDTLSRSFVGYDENSQKDSGVWIDSAERLRNLGKTVIIVHHTKKNTEFGYQYRGSTVLMGAMDTSINMAKTEDGIVFGITKQKDHDEGRPVLFHAKSMGEVDSVVLLPVPPEMDERFTLKGQTIDDVLQEIISDNSFRNDATRAAKLVEILASKDIFLTKSAAKTRISRLRASSVPQ